MNIDGSSVGTAFHDLLASSRRSRAHDLNSLLAFEPLLNCNVTIFGTRCTLHMLTIVAVIFQHNGFLAPV